MPRSCDNLDRRRRFILQEPAEGAHMLRAFMLHFGNRWDVIGINLWWDTMSGMRRVYSAKILRFLTWEANVLCGYRQSN